MGLFSKRSDEHHSAPRHRSVGEWLLIAVVILVVVQILGLVLNSWVGTPIYLGPGFLLIAVAASVVLAFGFVSNFINHKPLDKREIIVMILVFIITALALVYFRKLLPEVFQPSAMSFKALAKTMIGLP